MEYRAEGEWRTRSAFVSPTKEWNGWQKMWSPFGASFVVRNIEKRSHNSVAQTYVWLVKWMIAIAVVCFVHRVVVSWSMWQSQMAVWPAQRESKNKYSVMHEPNGTYTHIYYEFYTRIYSLFETLKDVCLILCAITRQWSIYYLN